MGLINAVLVEVAGNGDGYVFERTGGRGKSQNLLFSLAANLKTALENKV